MTDFREKKIQKLFFYDDRAKRTGTFITFGGMLLLVFAVILIVMGMQGKLDKGFVTAAYVMIPAVFVLEALYFLFFYLIHGRIGKLVAEFAFRCLAEDKNLMPLLKENADLVFAWKEGKKFVLYEKGAPNRKMYLIFKDFTSFYDGDTAFYRQTAAAIAQWFSGRDGFYNVTLSADYRDKKWGVAPYTLWREGKESGEAVKLKRKLKKK